MNRKERNGVGGSGGKGTGNSRCRNGIMPRKHEGLNIIWKRRDFEENSKKGVGEG